MRNFQISSGERKQSPSYPQPQKSSLVSDTLKIVSGTAIAQVLNALATPFLARLYMPEEYGVFGTFTSFSLILSTIICLRYDIAIVLPKQDEDAVDLVRVSLISSIILSLVLGLLFTQSIVPLPTQIISQSLLEYKWVLAFNLIGMGFFQTFTFWSTRQKRYWWLSLARIGSTVITIILQISMAFFLGSTAMGLIFGFSAGFFISALIQFMPIWRKDFQIFFHSFSSLRLFENIKRYRKFPFVDSWNAILNAASWNLVPVLIFTLFSSSQAGYYSMAYRLIQVPVALISVAVGQVFYQHSSRVKENENELVRIASSVLRRLTALGLFPALLLTIIGKDLFTVFLGATWAEAGIYVQIMGIWLFFWFLSNPFSVLTGVMERQELAVVIEIINLVCRVLAILIGSYFGSIYLALGLFAGSGIIIFSGYTFVCLRLIHMPVRLVLKPLIEFAPVSIFLALSVLMVKIVYHPSPILMTTLGLIIASGYAILILHRGILNTLD
jgi:O-antigen/teichoic acid export membrane protein